MELKDPVEFVIRELAKKEGQEVADYYNAEDIGEGTVQEQVALEYSDIFNEFIVKLNKLIPTITKVEVEDIKQRKSRKFNTPKQKKQKKQTKIKAVIKTTKQVVKC